MRREAFKQLIFQQLGLALDCLSLYIIKRSDQWYVKSNFPKMVKEFLFLGMILPANLIGDLADFLLNQRK